MLQIELQTHSDDEMRERLAEYAIRLWRHDRLPVRSAVVFLRPTALTPVSPYVIEWDGRELLRCNFDIIRLWEIPQEQIMGPPRNPEILRRGRRDDREQKRLVWTPCAL